jgi:molybdenum cofactor guanylyltransferase
MKGIVLAGGNSSRMGENKALLCYGAEPQWSVAANLLAPYCEEVFISSNSVLSGNYKHIADTYPFLNTGPISGLLSAFSSYQDDYFVLPIDYPFLTKYDLDLLISNFNTSKSSTVMHHATSDFYEPFIGIYAHEFLRLITSSFDSKKSFSMQHFLKENNIHKTFIADEKNLQSVNTFEHYTKIKNKWP